MDACPKATISLYTVPSVSNAYNILSPFANIRLRVVSSFLLGDRRESNLEKWESARKVRRGQKEARGGREEAEKEMEKRRLQTTHC